MKNKSIFVIIMFIAFMNVVYASQENYSQKYLIGKEQGYNNGLKEGLLASKSTDKILDKDLLVSQIQVPEPQNVPEKSIDYQKGYKDGWNEGYKKGYEKGSEEGNEGYLFGLLLGLFGVIIAYFM